jgi:transcriptional regulator with XRE-family HTH domain
MARKAYTRMPPSTGDDSTPRSLTKQEFGRRLYNLMMKNNWNQSDLARAAFGLDEHGQAKGRDSVSSYIRGRSFPDPKNLKKLADALGIEPHELLPNTLASAIEIERPAFQMRQAEGHSDKVWLQVNQLVTFKIAAKIVDILKGED